MLQINQLSRMKSRLNFQLEWIRDSKVTEKF